MDLETLMMLEGLDVPNEFEVKKKMKNEKGKPKDHYLVCHRCNELKGQNKLVEIQPPKFEAGRPLQLSDHVLGFNREAIIKKVFG